MCAFAHWKLRNTLDCAYTSSQIREDNVVGTPCRFVSSTGRGQEGKPWALRVRVEERVGGSYLEEFPVELCQEG